MVMMEHTVKCRICGKPYVIYAMYAGDQSACSECRAEARKGVSRPSTPEEIARRKKHFGNL